MECCERHLRALTTGSASEVVERPWGEAPDGAGQPMDLMADHHATNQHLVAAIRFEEHASFHLAEAAVAADAVRSHRIDGASTLSGWAAHHGRTSRSSIRRDVRRGRAISAYPLLRASWASHEISAAHVDVFARLIDDNDPVRVALLKRDETLLVGTATELTVDEFARVARHWEALAHPDGHEQSWAANHDRRHLSTARDLQGNLVFGGQLDGAEGDAFMQALDRLEQQLFDADWSEAMARLGREPTVGELCRTNAHRRADALVVLVCGSSDADPLRPSISIDYVIDHDTFEQTLDRLERGAIGVCQSHDIDWIPALPAGSLAEFNDGDRLPDTGDVFDALRRSETLTGIPLPPAVIVADAFRARVRRVVFEGPGVIVNAGRSRRLFDGPQRHLVALVHGRCGNCYCDRPHWQCEIDHKLPWDAGGATDLVNAQPLCRPDHRRKSRRQQVRLRTDGNLQLNRAEYSANVSEEPAGTGNGSPLNGVTAPP